MKNLNDKGFLEVDHYKIYWEDWGNKNIKTPIFLLHGGPGGGFSDKDKKLFDFKKHRVIFHDQRGSGKSTPFAGINKNTTQYLVEDIETLRKHLGFKKIYIAGGSWGSALSLFYTITHPGNVEKFLIWSVFLARQFEVDFVNEGEPRFYFPNQWDRFISLVPKKFRKNGDSVMNYYAKKIRSRDKEIAKKYADEWTLWELTLCSIEYNEEQLIKEVLGDKKNLSIASLETHYFLNKCFVPENYIFDNLEKIKHIPCYVIQGRFDMCTPPVSARDLAETYGKNIKLEWVNSGHLQSDKEMNRALKKAFINFFKE